jgi:hypothetical protein
MANLLAQAIPGGMTNEILNNWDALKADFDAVAYLPFGDEYWDAMNQIMNGIGNREIAKQQIVNWFEMNRMEVPFTCDNGPVAISGVTGNYTVTLPSSEVDQTTGYSFPIPNEIYRAATTGALFQIVSKTASKVSPFATSVVLRPLSTATTAAILDNEKFFFVGVSVEENSGAQDPKFVFDTKYSAKLQTFRNDALSSSEALYNQLWYSQLENGTATPYSNSRDIIYLQREHQVGIVNTFLAGQTNTNTGMNGYQFTNGLIPTIQTSGQTVACSGGAGSGFDVDDLYALEAKLSKIDGSVKNYMVWTSGQSSSVIEKTLLDYNKNANISINKVQMEKTFWGEGAYADLMSSTYSFNNLVFNNKNFGLVRMGIFDNPQTFNVTSTAGDNPWPGYAVFLPMTSQGVDDGLGNMGKYIRLAHKPGAFMNMWQTGGRAAANKTDKWQLGVHIVSEIAFKFINAQKYGLLTGVVEA